MKLALTFFICTTKVTLGFYLSRHFCTLKPTHNFLCLCPDVCPSDDASMITIVRAAPSHQLWRCWDEHHNYLSEGGDGGNLDPALNGWGTTKSHTVRTGPRSHFNALLSKQHPESRCVHFCPLTRKALVHV